MKRLFVWIFIIAGIGAYLYYVRGWDLVKLRQETIDKLPFVGGSATTTPIGARGSGTHWETASPMPTPRTDFGAALVDGKIYVVGGFDGYGRTLDSVDVYDPEKDEWKMAPRMPQALHHPAVTTDGMKLYVIGGFVGISFEPVDETFVYDPIVKEWSPAGNLNDFRGAGAAAFVQGALHVAGGTNRSGPIGFFETFDPAKTAWNVERASLPTPREQLCAVELGGKFYAIGGRIGDAAHNLSTVDVWDPKTGKWTSGPPLQHPRGGFAAATLDGQIFVFGGEEVDGTTPGVETLEPQKNAWEPFGLSLPTPRHGLAAVPYKNRIYVLGGGKRSGFSVSPKNEVLIIGEMKKTPSP